LVTLRPAPQQVQGVQRVQVVQGVQVRLGREAGVVALAMMRRSIPVAAEQRRRAG
jgi:hypothetical protein